MINLNMVISTLETRQAVHPYPYSHSFARYFLKTHNIEILRNNLPIFSYKYPPIPQFVPSYFHIKEDDIKFKTKASFDIPIDTIKPMNYFVFQRYGYVIIKIPVKKLMSKASKFIYKITKGNITTHGYVKSLPKDHTILFSTTYKAFRLNGPRAINEWIYTQEKYIDPLSDERLFKFKTTSFIDEEHEQEIKIEEIPVGIALDENKLICLPVTGDVHRIVFTGSSRKGKSKSAHSLIDNLYYKGNMMFVLNDWNSENYAWSLPTTEKNFIKLLEPLNISPKPLPCVYLYPNFKGCTEEKYLQGGDEGLAVNISLDWATLLSKYHEYTSFYKGLSFERSLKYIDVEKIANCKTFEEVEEYMEIVYQNPAIPKESKAMIDRILNFIASKDVTNITSGIPSKYTVRKLKFNETIASEREYSPVMSCLYAGLIPIFRPRELESVQMGSEKAGSILPLYMHYLIDDVYKTKIADEHFKDKTLYVVIDELSAIMQKGVYAPIIEIASRGRFNKTGLITCLQSYSDLPKEVRENTEIIFCFGASKREIQEMRRDNYVITKEVEDDLGGQIGNKIKFECYAIFKRPLIAYSLEDGKREKLDGDVPIKMKFLSNLSKHSKPGEG